jgi:hypothetical protein
MERHIQEKKELVSKLSEVKTDWTDEFSSKFIEFLLTLPENLNSDNSTIKKILDLDYKNAMLLFRLAFEQYKDEFTLTLKSIYFDSKSGAGIKLYKNSPAEYISKLQEYGLSEKLNTLVRKKFTWKDILIERLKGGRGSAIKGQTRGRNLEDFVEALVKQLYDSYDTRVSFIGKDGERKAKADFCIPSKDQPNIIIEVKAYGATGSKQTDVIGDIEKIIKEKRSDTIFLLVSDGVTWKARLSDFEKLVDYQNQGYIYRIYTQAMSTELLADLKQLKAEMKL